MNELDLDFDARIWERLTVATVGKDEPAELFRIFELYARSSPRSLRLAVVRARGLEEGSAEAAAVRASGGLLRSARYWRWHDRLAAWDLHNAEEERGAFEKARVAARRRRVAMLDRATVLIAKRLTSMKDLKRMPAHRVIDAMVKTMEAEREELRDAREDDAAHLGEHEPDLPSIESKIPPPPEPTPPKPPDHEDEGRTP
jgi:hypothetical protein